MMKLYLTLALPLILGQGLAQDAYRLELHPLDFQANLADDFLPSIDQIESNGHHIYVRSIRYPKVAVIDRHGRSIRMIGGSGGHPSEFRTGIMAMALKGESLWLVDNQLERARLFQSGIFRTSFRLDSFNKAYAMPNANAFAFTEKVVMIPAHPDTGHLAAAMSYNGNLIQRTGEPLPFSLYVNLIPLRRQQKNLGNGRTRKKMVPFFSRHAL